MIRQEPLSQPIPSLPGVRARPLLAGMTLAVIILTVLWLPSLAGARWYSDEGVFAAVAQTWRGGATLYDGAWDNKPPLIFLTYASAQAVFGDSLVAPRALALLAAGGAVAITVVVSARIYGHARGTLAGAIAAVALGSPIIEGNLALTETFMVFPAAAGVLITISVLQRDADDDTRARRLLLAAGLCFGLAMGYKQVAVFDLAATALVLLVLYPRPLRALAPLLVGAMIPQLAFLLFFAATGAGSGYVYAVIGSMPDYSVAVEDPKPVWSAFAGYVPAAIALICAVANRRSLDIRAFPAIWFAFAFAGAASSPYSFPHYLAQAAVPFALSVAMLSYAPSLSPARAAAPAAVAIATIAAALAVFGPEIRDRQQSSPRWYYDTALDYASGRLTRDEYEGRMDGAAYSVQEIAIAIAHDGRGDDRGDGLFVWADLPWLYATTGLENPTPFATPWLVKWVPGAHEDVIDDLQANPPAYIVISANVERFPELDALVARDYQLIAQRWDWQLYGRELP